MKRDSQKKEVMTKGACTRSHILAATLKLINTQGYHATTLRDITDATGVQKGNLYFHYPGKEALVVAVVEWAWQEYRTYLVKRAGRGLYGDRLCRLLNGVLHFHRQNGLSGGCLFGNLAMETADTVPGVAEAVSRVLDESLAGMGLWIERAVEDGSLAPVDSSRTLALRILTGVEGGILLARLKRDIDILELCVAGLKAELRSAV
ncbi:TetR/AcrR family transcriptional regulator [Desulfobotulus sp. H1]|uniref:TetR/AcrR family transcriptional regulator n=1 Tax=Desulfobotulus pelophilus TaxID=2823377 RepID=A0ABT3NCZ7_9BACT|nr:TetR/AcrR family transcriptional regulator [Desulfobotulus pelophilus]MCW7755332.1 TetR/AcrR family transcriptional regulator [Desulfobotulus pelophilus]